MASQRIYNNDNNMWVYTTSPVLSYCENEEESPLFEDEEYEETVADLNANHNPTAASDTFGRPKDRQ